MKTRKKYLLLLPFFVFTSLSAGNKPYGLLTDLIEHTDRTWQNGYASNLPVWKTDEAIEALQFATIGSTHPSFSWIVPGKAQGTRQVSYRIIVADSWEEISSGNGNVWDSGVTNDDNSISVLYKGTALQPNKNYFWRVKTRTNTEGESDWSEIKAFRTASNLSAYAASYYPQVKSLEYPVSLTRIAEDIQAGDFGKDAFGQLILTLSSVSGKDTVRVHMGEQLKDSRVNRTPGGTVRYHCYSLPLLKGTNTYRIKIKKDERNTGAAAVLMPEYIGEIMPFRYVEIEGYQQPLQPGMLVREHVHYPFDDTASSFESDNDMLNQIWDLCKYSIRATSYLGIYVDGDRERIPYEADALINQLCHYGVDREYSLARRSHEYLLEYPTWPTEWILQAVLIAWYDYLYTGDNRSLRSYYDLLKNRTLTRLKTETGLISTTTGLQTEEFQRSIRFKGNIRDIVDWPHTGILGLNKNEGGEIDGFEFTDYNAVTNAFHYEALKWMGRIAEAIDMPTEAELYNKQAAAFRKLYNKSFFNTSTGTYKDGVTSSHSALHTNMMPIAFGMVDKNRQKKVMDFIKSRGMACSVYGSQFLMDAVYEANEADYGLQLLTKDDDRSWYNMIRVGSTISLEAWDDKYKPNQDWNHAWGAVPANTIPRKLMGVEPLVPGFAVARIKPQLSKLAWAKATIPTIRGEINMEIQNKADEYVMQLVIPANMDAEVYLPLPDRKYTVTVNNESIKTERVKDEPFIYLGKLSSGTYLITCK